MSNQEIEQLEAQMENLSLNLTKDQKYIDDHEDEFQDYCEEYKRFGTDDADEYKIVNNFKSKVKINQKDYEYSTFNFTDFFVFGTIDCFLQEIPKMTLPELKKLCDDLAITKYSNYLKSRSKKDVVVEYITAFIKHNNKLMKEGGKKFNEYINVTPTEVRNEIIKCLTINHNVTYECFYVIFIDKEDDSKYEFINDILEYDPKVLLHSEESDEEIDDEKEEKSCSSTNNKKKEIKQEFNVCELLVEEAFQLYKRVCEADQSLDDTDIEHFLFLINELNEDDVKILNIRVLEENLDINISEIQIIYTLVKKGILVDFRLSQVGDEDIKDSDNLYDMYNDLKKFNKFLNKLNIKDNNEKYNFAIQYYSFAF